MKKNFLCLFAAILFTQAASAQSTLTHEETYVRTAYAKLSYATELAVISGFAMDELGSGKTSDPKLVASQMSAKELTFDLSHFSVGNISDIQDVPWRNLITPLDTTSRVLDASFGTHFFQEDDLANLSWADASAKWGQARADEVNLPEYQQVGSMPLKQIIALGGSLWTYPDVVYTRYAEFTVTAHLGGLTVGPYRAIFFFGKNAKGEEVVAPQDLVVRGSALFQASQEPLYPTAFMRSRLRQTPTAARWLNSIANATGKATGSLFCSVSDSETRCGVSNADLQHELSIPLPIRHSPTGEPVLN